MKAVIIAGGLGQRLAKVTKGLPKSLVQIAGKVVLEYQLNLLVKNGFKEVWILLGFRGEMIRDFLGDGKKWQIKINYSQEESPLGTAGALKNITEKLSGDFLVLYGDVMANFDIKRLIRFHRQVAKKSLATLVVHPNNHPQDSDLVEIKNNQIINIYPKPQPVDGGWRHNLVLAAVYILSPKIFPFIPTNKQTDFGKDIFPALLKKKKTITAYKTWEYIRDMGSLNQLKAVKQDCKSGVYQSLHYQNRQKAIFLDRDGVINEEVDELINIDDLRIYPFSYQAIKKINQAGFLAIVITNQPMIAKGKLSPKQLDLIHQKLETLLGNQGAIIEAIYYCPHHPQVGFKGEIKKLKIKCNCRKPKTGLIKQAVKDFNIDLKKSFFIGDSIVDYQTAKNAKLKFIGVKTGYGLKETDQYVKLDTSETVLKKNLALAVEYILNFKKQW